MDLLDMDDKAAADAWSEAAARGFHGSHLTPERAAEFADANRARRNTGVWDVGSSSLEPVGTSNSWISRLAVPGDRTLDAWAISTVTVAPTHHKRGIARALVEAELDGPFGAAAFLVRTLHRRGVSIAPGTWVSSGAITGVHEVTPGQTVEALFDGKIRVGCRIESL